MLLMALSYLTGNEQVVAGFAKAGWPQMLRIVLGVAKPAAAVVLMVSIKSTHSKGNFQLTLTHLAGPDEVLLDTDIDENGDLLAHFLDLFKHKITGGTHPHDIHEVLVHQEGQSPGFDLGYRLV